MSTSFSRPPWRPRAFRGVPACTFALTALAACLTISAGAPAADAPAVSDVSVAQPIIAGENQVFTAGGTVTVAYTLSAPGEVSIEVFRAQPMGIGTRWYADDSTRVGRFAVPAGKAGRQTFSFKPADHLHPPVAPGPMPTKRPREIAAKKPAAAQPAQPPDVLALPDTLVVQVRSGANAAHVTAVIHPAGGTILSSRTVPSFMGAAHDSRGNILVADRKAWRGRRYTPDWRLDITYPQASLGMSSDPVECHDVARDSKDNLFIMTPNGIYRYGSDGNPAAWTSDDDYLKHPYPSSIKNLLGIRIAKEPGKKRYVYGPGGGGAGSKEYDSAEAVKNPGFAYEWGGLAVDAQDNIYLGIVNPNPQIQVFAPSGKFLRAIPMADGPKPRNLRFTPDGGLWVSDRAALFRINKDSGAVEKKVDRISAARLHVGADGTLYAYDSAKLWRFTPAGGGIPFTAKAPYVRDGGKCLWLSAKENKVPDLAGGYANHIFSVVGGRAGDFLISSGASANPVNNIDNRLVHFAQDGTFLIDSLAVAFLPHETGNVFTGDEQAMVAVQVANLTQQAETAAFEAAILDIDSKAVAGHKQSLDAPPMTILSTAVPIAPGAGVCGYWEIQLSATAAGRRAAADACPVASRLRDTLYGGRVAERTGEFHPYSPFGSVRMEGNPELIRRAGGGLNRNHNPVYWNEVEPQPGQWHLQPANALDFYRRRAMPAMVILGYGEPWLKGGFAACRIYRYDTFWDYIATVAERFRGTPMMWQFWNEPNYFWHVPGPYRYEHYVMVLEGTYAILKAYDPETPVICDGFAGSARDMADLAAMGAGGFTEGVPIHYPGAKTVSFDNMPIKGPVESKADMVRELAAIRDRHYPGQPLLNTEEGLWGKQDRTPRSGAELLPRIYVSQIAAGIDRLTWFECFSVTDPTYLLRTPEKGPWPAYFAYAAASRALEDAQYVGPISSGIAQVHLFAVKGEPLAVAWAIEGEKDFSLQAGAAAVTVGDWAGNADKVPTRGGTLDLKLGPRVRYIAGMDAKVFAPVAEKRIATGRKDPAIAAAVDTLASGGGTAPADLNGIFHAARLAEVAALLPDAAKPGDVVAASAALDKAAQAVRQRQADGRYLRAANTVLAIARRAAYFMNLAESGGAKPYAARLAPAVSALARQVELHTAADACPVASRLWEKPWYPGVMLRVALDTSEARQKTPPDQPLDEKFNPQISRKPGENFELELTLYNHTRATLKGTARPVLPPGWKAATAAFDYAVEPRKFARFAMPVTIPTDAKDAVYPVGASTEYKGTEQRELHTHRVEVKR